MTEQRAPGITAVATIISKNYLAYARTLMDSLARVHPEWHRFVLLVDEVDGCFEPARENFQVICVADLALPERDKFLFRYDVLELNTAVKPWFLEWLFAKTQAERVVYLDPDISVYHQLNDVEQLLHQGALMVLTPHLLDTLSDGRRPHERDILQAGCFNLGFLALSRHPELPRFLAWWQRKLEFDCRVDLAEGLFVDQRWMDLAPGLFADVAVLRHPGYNVAYWNLSHRPVRLTPTGPCVGTAPLVFFHFSGLDPGNPASFSKHQDRFRLADVGEAAPLVEAYCRAVLQNGWAQCRSWPYAFGVLRDGTPIGKSMRRYYRSKPLVERRISDPFADGHEYLNEPWGSARTPLITRLMRFIWESRADLRDALPDIDGVWREHYANQFVDFIAAQEGVPERFVAPVRSALRGRTAQDGSSSESNWHSELQLFAPLSEDETTSLTGGALRLLARLALVALPLPRSPDRLRRLYHWLYPLRWLVPSPIRRELKRDLLRWLHRRHTQRRPGMLRESMRTLGRWVRQLFRKFRPAAPEHAAPQALTPSPSETGVPELGVNIVGYLDAATGVGQSMRLAAQSAWAAGLPFLLHNFAPDGKRGAVEARWLAHLANDNLHPINLFHINADQMARAHAILGKRFFAGRYNIGYWHWELPEFPERWLDALELVDEVWAPSRFVQDAVAARSRRPVLRIPHGIHFKIDEQVTRGDLGLPADEFLFLVMYDMDSFQERKNPEGAIEAFCRAFAGAPGVSLIIKVNHSVRHPRDTSRLKARLAQAPNVRALETVMSRQDVYNLQSLCDCYVSLHRAEGFGLGPAEAMFLGKPVIATAWSGTEDFMTERNSCPVDYRLVRLERDVGPYERGQHWAEPDLDHAAHLMQKVVADASWRRAIGAAAQADIRSELAPERIGQLYRERLEAIQRGLHGAPQSMRSAA